MAQKLITPSESAAALADSFDSARNSSPEQPPRPDVTLALLRDDGLELAICHADDRCDFELLNLTHDPCCTWDESVRIPLHAGENWRPVSGESGVLLVELAQIKSLALAGEHTVMIRQVTSDGRVSVQSLFRIVDWGAA
ncbi:MAG: hypothetical protein H7Z43_10195 [Clostridia bacterium]|nr:hypothetical protein [Deltaproteobacteria bacterium]